jgi:iron transport multicopper oxidase
MRLSLLSSLLLAAVARAGTVIYDWEASWVTAAPDGFERRVIGINGKWPCPKIEAQKGDTVIIKLKNSLGDQTTGLHFHGINQILTNEMDGPSGSTQCPAPPGHTITYTFLVCFFFFLAICDRGRCRDAVTD